MSEKPDITETLWSMIVEGNSGHIDYYAALREARNEIQMLRSENERLRAALEPFARAYYPSLEDYSPDLAINVPAGTLIVVQNLADAKACFPESQIEERASATPSAPPAGDDA